MTGGLKKFSTDAVPPKERFDYWHGEVLRGLYAIAPADTAPRFTARLMSFSGDKPDHDRAEMFEHSGSALIADRDAARIRRDGGDYICIYYTVNCNKGTVSHGSLDRHRLNSGDLMILDVARPFEVSRSSHRVISLYMSRACVRAAYGDLSSLGGRFLQHGGMPGMLRAHMQNAMDQAALLSPQQRVMAVNIASDMAISILQAEQPAPAEMEATTGLYHAAMMLITQDCANPELNPLGIASALGCSRASLYRAFRQQQETIADAIWAARLARAYAMLRAPACRDWPISEISFRSGFHEISTFNKMFRNKYGMTPRDMRDIKYEVRPHIL